MSQPIGVFDSGIGGLTVVKHLFQQLPHESIVYFGDTARVPYGSKSVDTIRRYAMEDTRFLMSKEVKFIVVACNTTSAVAMKDIGQVFQNPVVGVIEPGARAAVKNTHTRRVGVIGTKATINSEAYSKAIAKLDPTIQVFSSPCPLFVPLVEEGMLQGEITNSIIRMYLEPLLKNGIDTLVLGCTHYPLLRQAIQGVVSNLVTLIDSGEAAAIEVKEQLAQSSLETKSQKNGEHQFYVSDSVADFEKVGNSFLGEKLPKVKKTDIEEFAIPSPALW